MKEHVTTYLVVKKEKRQFKVIIEQDEDGYFVGSVSALPGCYTQAKTLPDLHKRIREAISLCLEAARDDGQYRAKTKRFSYEPTAERILKEGFCNRYYEKLSCLQRSF